ncbi:MAG: NrsF family protein [Polyangiales bacterium]
MSVCDALEDAVAEGVALSDAQRAHAAACERCRALTATDDALARVVNTSAVEPRGEGDALPPALRAALEADAAPVRPYSFARRVAVPALVTSLLALGALRYLPRADLAHRAVAPFAVGALTLFALALVGAVGLLYRGARGLGVSVARRAGYLVAAFALAELAVAAAADPVEGSVVLRDADVLRGIVHCASYGVAVSLVAGAGLFAVARRTVIAAPAVAGAVAGAAAGITGTLVLHVACPIASLTHAMIAHVAPVLVGALVGGLAGRRVLEV